jgi:hypothetical protein
MKTTRPWSVLTTLAFVVTLVAVPLTALAQPDDDGYPIEVEPEVVVRDDVLVTEPVTEPPVIPVREEADVAVLGVQLPVTGSQLLLLASTGLAFALVGATVLVRTRRARVGRAG